MLIAYKTEHDDKLTTDSPIRVLACASLTGERCLISHFFFVFIQCLRVMFVTSMTKKIVLYMLSFLFAYLFALFE